ncbi:hypothetical protein [Actinomadura macrotermitis]|uniref:Uncharacterized protein n=1 Tax=Actinomadura macrotermitis TaxID=2585200 RepID=A0A7K0BSP7_9ACTN|nr:hypothetical protein [Actinomadura macrotermitis]MQY04181.1 hypothetical protein [Actinomadura macrotermitis]
MIYRTAAPARPARPRWVVPAATSAVTAVVTAGTVFGTAALLDDGGGHGARPTAPAKAAAPPPAASAARDGTFTQVASACALIPTATRRRLVPEKAEVHAYPAEDRSAGVSITECEWSSKFRPGPQRHRTLRLSVSVYPEDDGSAEQLTARKSLEFEARVDGSMSHEKDGTQSGSTYHYLPGRWLQGLGDKGFVSAHRKRDKEGDWTFAQVFFVQKNLFVKLAFSGSNAANEKLSTKSTELKPGVYTPALEQAARETLAALNACADCHT